MSAKSFPLTRPSATLSPSGRGKGRFVWGLAMVVLSGCRSEMYEQPRYEPLEASGFFEDGASSRPLVAGTVPRRPARRAAGRGR